MLMHTYMPNANAGTVVFWHGRLGHEAGPNYGSKIRQAILYDFSRKDMNERDTAPPSDSMWRDWSEEVKTIAAAHGHDATPLTADIYQQHDGQHDNKEDNERRRDGAAAAAAAAGGGGARGSKL